MFAYPYVSLCVEKNQMCVVCRSCFVRDPHAFILRFPLGVLPCSLAVRPPKGYTMSASSLFTSLRFVGGRPMLILRDHTEGRIKVFLKGVWVATVIPGPLMDLDCEAVLLGIEDDGYYDHIGLHGIVVC